MIFIAVGVALSVLVGIGKAQSLLIPNPVSSSHQTATSLKAVEEDSVDSNPWMQQGRDSYQAGRFAQAVTSWQQAIALYQNRQDDLNSALVSSYLALAYQQLGAWSEATEAIATSMGLLQQQPLARPRASVKHQLVLAQTLNTQGSLQFAQGQTEQALESWQRATAAYAQAGDETRQIGSLINQAQAQQTLGLYLQARRTLTEVEQTLQQQADTEIKAIGLQTLAGMLRTVGALDESRQLLQQSLAIAETLDLPSVISSTLLSSGNTAQAQGDRTAALMFYQRAAATATSDLSQLQAQLNQLALFTELEQWQAVQSLLPTIEARLNTLPSSRDTIYAKINFAQRLIEIINSGTSTTTVQQIYPKAAQMLSSAVQQARQLSDQRAEAYALGQLGRVYEKNNQWIEAKTVTQQALLISQAVNAADIAYQWQWQLGRIFNAQGNPEDARLAYQAAFDTLQSVRRELIATSSDVQFSFRENVEPVYREFVDLLLKPTPSTSQSPPSTSQSNLRKAREVIESLQLAELDNFFRSACLDGQRVAIDQVNQTNTAVIYPIILRDRLEVLFSLPQQPIRQYTTSVSEQTIDDTVNQLRQQLARPLTSQDGQRLGQRIYDWLIRPFAADLAANQTKTLVFVLDGALRNIPMATLYDGDRYLIETYSLALTPGLQLLSPQPLSQLQLEVLAAGLTEERSGFSALVNVERELSEIQTELPSQILLNEAFTSSALQTQIDALPFPIVHLATHGQFSSKADETFVLAWDRPINVNELSSLLRNSDDTRPNPIELLVLSACETAAGDTRATLGLAGIAIQAGARSTLASLWTLNDESAAQLIGQFYRELANATISKAEALQRAQLSLLRDPNYRHPIYWAPYVLVGNWL